MSNPQFKQSFLQKHGLTTNIRRIPPPEGPPPRPARRGKAAPRRARRGKAAPRRVASRGPVAPSLGPAVLIIGILLTGLIPDVEAQAGTVLEDFESYSPGSLPCEPDTFVQPCTTANGFTYSHDTGSFFVTDATADTGTNSFRSSGESYLQESSGTDFCGPTPINLAVANLAAVGVGDDAFSVAGEKTDNTGNQNIYFLRVVSATVGGTASIQLVAQRIVGGVAAGASVSTSSLVFTNSYSTTAFYHFSIFCPIGASGGSFVVSSPEALALGNGPQSAVIPANAGTPFVAVRTLRMGDTGQILTYDNIETELSVTLESNQVAVTGLVGGSMDGMGQHIIARINNGADVATYGTQDLTQSAIDATGCSRFDGVVSSDLGPDNVIFASYAACTESAGIVNILRIRDANLGTPEFTEDCEGEPTENVANNDEIDVPDNLAQMGTIGDMAYDFAECINPSGPARAAFASWTFSSSVDGWLAAFGVAYGQNQAGFDDETSHEEHAPAIDTSTAPLEVEDFCSFTGTDGNDYIGGVAEDGVAAVYEVERSASLNTVSTPFLEIDFTFDQKFRNAGLYAGSSGIACARNTVAFQTPTEIRVLTNITTTPSLLYAIPNPAVVQRGLAISGSAEFLFYRTATSIEVFDLITGNNTGADIPVPSGDWRLMESDIAAQTLAIFTSDFITVVEAGPATCETRDNCEEFGGIGDDDAPNPGPGDGDGDGDGTGGATCFSGDLEECPYFWVFLWMAVLLIATALLSTFSRAGFGPIVYGIEAMAVYVIGILVYGIDEISPWPIAVLVGTTIGLVIWSRSR